MADPNPDVTSVVQNNLGWIAALGTGAWGWVLRMILGRHLKVVDELRATLTNIDKRLSFIEGRFKQKDADAGGDYP